MYVRKSHTYIKYIVYSFNYIKKSLTIDTWYARYNYRITILIDRPKNCIINKKRREKKEVYH